MKRFVEGTNRAQSTLFPESLDDYIAEDNLDRADRDPSVVTEARAEHLKRKIELGKAQMQELRAVGERLKQSPDGQVSLTDPDARSMATRGRGTGVVGNNVQAAVDAKHHMIVAHEVTNVGHDRTQLASMSRQAREAMNTEELTVLADRGYFKGEEILACDRLGINALVPKPQTSNNQAKGQFDKRHFRYIAADDEYECPAGQRATRRFATVEDGMTLYKYWSSACPACPLRTKCTNGKYRRITGGHASSWLKRSFHTASVGSRLIDLSPIGRGCVKTHD